MFCSGRTTRVRTHKFSYLLLPLRKAPGILTPTSSNTRLRHTSAPPPPMSFPIPAAERVAHRSRECLHVDRGCRRQNDLEPVSTLVVRSGLRRMAPFVNQHRALEAHHFLAILIDTTS